MNTLVSRQVAGDTAVMPNQTGSSDGSDGTYDAMRPAGAGHATSAEALGEMVPHWVFLYQRLTTEGDRRVSSGPARRVVLYRTRERAGGCAVQVYSGATGVEM